MLDPSAVPDIVGPVELRDPQPGLIFDDSLRAGSAHRRADQHQVFDLFLCGTGGNVLIRDDGIGDPLHLRQVKGLVECALGCRWRLVEAEAKRSRAVIRREEQIFQLALLRFAEVALNHAAAPVVRAGVAQRAKDAT